MEITIDDSILALHNTISEKILNYSGKVVNDIAKPILPDNDLAAPKPLYEQLSKYINNDEFYKYIILQIKKAADINTDTYNQVLFIGLKILEYVAGKKEEVKDKIAEYNEYLRLKEKFEPNLKHF